MYPTNCSITIKLAPEPNDPYFCQGLTPTHYAAQFAENMMRRVFELSRTHDAFNHNDADRKARNFFLLAAWVKEAADNGHKSVTITQAAGLPAAPNWRWGMEHPYLDLIRVNPDLMAALTAEYRYGR